MSALIESIVITIDNQAEAFIEGLPIYTKENSVNIKGVVAEDVYNRFNLYSDGQTLILNVTDSSGNVIVDNYPVKQTDLSLKTDGNYEFNTDSISDISVDFIEEGMVTVELSAKDDLNNSVTKQGNILVDWTPPNIDKIEVRNAIYNDSFNYLGELVEAPNTVGELDLYYNTTEGVGYLYKTGTWVKYSVPSEYFEDGSSDGMPTYTFTNDPGDYILIEIEHDGSINKDGSFDVFVSKNDGSDISHTFNFKNVYVDEFGNVANPLIVPLMLPNPGNNELIEVNGIIKDEAGNVSTASTVEVAVMINDVDTSALSATLSNGNVQVIETSTEVSFSGTTTFKELVQKAELVVSDSSGELERKDVTNTILSNDSFVINENQTFFEFFSNIPVVSKNYFVKLELEDKKETIIETNEILLKVDNEAPIVSIKDEYKNDVTKKLVAENNSARIPVEVQEKNLENNKIKVYEDGNLLTISDDSNTLIESEGVFNANINLILSEGVHTYSFEVTDKNGKVGTDSMKIEYKNSYPRIKLTKANTNAAWDKDELKEDNRRILRTPVDHLDLKILLENDWQMSEFSTDNVVIDYNSNPQTISFVNGEADYIKNNLPVETNEGLTETKKPIDIYTRTPSQDPMYRLNCKNELNEIEYQFKVSYDPTLYFDVKENYYTTTNQVSIYLTMEDYINNSDIITVQDASDETDVVAINSLNNDNQEQREFVVELPEINTLYKKYNITIQVEEQSLPDGLDRNLQHITTITQYNLENIEIDFEVLDKDLDVLKNGQPLINEEYALKVSTNSIDVIEKVFVDSDNSFSSPPPITNEGWMLMDVSPKIETGVYVPNLPLEGTITRKVFVKIKEIEEPITLTYDFDVDRLAANYMISRINNNTKTSKYKTEVAGIKTISSTSKYNYLQKAEIYVNQQLTTTINASGIYDEARAEIKNKNNIEELKEQDINNINNLDYCLVRNEFSYFEFQENSSVQPDGENTILPASLTESDPGRWIKISSSSNIGEEILFNINNTDEDGNYITSPGNINLLEEGVYEIKAIGTDMQNKKSETDGVYIEINNSVPNITVENLTSKNIKKDIKGFQPKVHIVSGNCPDGTIKVKANIVKTKQYKEGTKIIESLANTPVEIYNEIFDFESEEFLELDQTYINNMTDGVYQLEILAIDDIGNIGTTGVIKIEIYNGSPKLSFLEEGVTFNKYSPEGSIEGLLEVKNTILGIQPPDVTQINKADKIYSSAIEYVNAKNIPFKVYLQTGSNQISFEAINAQGLKDTIEISKTILFDKEKPEIQIKEAFVYKKENGILKKKKPYKYVDSLFINGRENQDQTYISLALKDFISEEKTLWP